MDSPKVAIIILNWNGIDDTIECLDSLKNINYPNYEVVVVDNCSQGSDVQILEENYGNYITLIKNDRNLGFTGGNNKAIEQLLTDSNPDYYLLLNNDTTVDPDFLTGMVATAESDRSIGIVGPKTYLYDEPDRFWLVWFKMDMYRGKAVHVGAGEKDEGQYDEIYDADFVPGSCLLIKREVINKVGLLDNKLVNYGDETDYCFRTRQAGYRVLFTPNAKIWHKVSRTSSKVSGLQEYYITRNRLLFTRKYATKKQLIISLAYLFLKEFWFYSAGILIRQKNLNAFKSLCKGIQEGLTTEI